MLKRLEVEQIDELGPLEAIEVGVEFGSGTEVRVKKQRIPLKRVGASCEYVKRQLNGVLSPDMVILTVRHEGEVYALTLGELFDLRSD